MINPSDVNAVEECLKLKDLHGAKVAVMTMGPAQAEEALRELLAMGVDRAIRSGLLLLTSDDQIGLPGSRLISLVWRLAVCRRVQWVFHEIMDFWFDWSQVLSGVQLN